MGTAQVRRKILIVNARVAEYAAGPSTSGHGAKDMRAGGAALSRPSVPPVWRGIARNNRINGDTERGGCGPARREPRKRSVRTWGFCVWGIPPQCPSTCRQASSELQQNGRKAGSGHRDSQWDHMVGDTHPPFLPSSRVKTVQCGKFGGVCRRGCGGRGFSKQPTVQCSRGWWCVGCVCVESGGGQGEKGQGRGR